MRRFCVPLAVAAAVLMASPGAASASTCYLVYDASDNIVYRDSVTPVDLSDRGAAAREALRQRGELLMIIDTDRCPRIAVSFAATGAHAAPADEYVAGIRPVVARDVTAVTEARRGAGAAPGGTTAPPAAARRSVPMTGY